MMFKSRVKGETMDNARESHKNHTLDYGYSNKTTLKDCELRKHSFLAQPLYVRTAQQTGHVFYH